MRQWIFAMSIAVGLFAAVLTAPFTVMLMGADAPEMVSPLVGLVLAGSALIIISVVLAIFTRPARS